MGRGRAAWVAALAACSACGDPDGAPVEQRPAIRWVPAKYARTADRGPADIDTIVIHTTEGRYDESRPFEENQSRVYAGVVRYFSDPGRRKVSAHYVVGPDGGVTRMVREKDIAFHATYYNARSIGIECAGWAARRRTWTPKLLEALADLVEALAWRYRVALDHPPGDARTSGGFFTGAGIVGHDQIQTPGSAAAREHAVRTDPGPYFPWAHFLEMVRSRRARRRTYR